MYSILFAIAICKPLPSAVLRFVIYQRKLMDSFKQHVLASCERSLNMYISQNIGFAIGVIMICSGNRDKIIPNRDYVL